MDVPHLVEDKNKGWSKQGRDDQEERALLKFTTLKACACGPKISETLKQHATLTQVAWFFVGWKRKQLQHMSCASLLVVACITCSTGNSPQTGTTILSLLSRTGGQINAFEDPCGLFQEHKVTFIWFGICIHRGILDIHFCAREELFIRTFLTIHPFRA